MPVVVVVVVVVCQSCGIFEGGTIKLCDFGLAKALLKEESVATMTTGVGTGDDCWVTFVCIQSPHVPRSLTVSSLCDYFFLLPTLSYFPLFCTWDLAAQYMAPELLQVSCCIQWVSKSNLGKR